MINDAPLNKFDLVYSKEIDRLSRNGALSYNLRDTLVQNKIDMYTHDNAINTINDDTMEYFGLFVWMAERESQKISTRIKRVKETQAKNGKYIGSTPPYGYKIVEGQLYIRNDETPAIVRRIFNEYLEGKGFDSIARGLYYENIPTPSQVLGREKASDKWQGSTIRKILSNPHYTGMLIQLRDTKPSVTSNRQQKPLEDMEIKEGSHEAIIPLETFLTVQELIIARKRTRPQQKANLFTNTIYCADCGRGMHFIKNRKGYVCGNYNKFGAKSCSSHFIKETQLADEILNDFKAFSKQIGIDKELVEQKINKDNIEITKVLTNYEQQINRLQANITKIVQKYANDEIGKVEYQQAINDINTKVKELLDKKEQLDKLSKDNNNKKDANKIIEELKSKLADIELSSALLHRMVRHIEVEACGTARIYYNFSLYK